MGLRGPPPTPTSLLEARGSWRAKTRRVAGELSASSDPQHTQVPRWLGPEARRIFQRMARQLRRARVLTNLDVWTLARYADGFARWLKLREFVAEYGEVYPIRKITRRATGDRDAETIVVGYRRYPHVDLLSSLARELLAIEREFGLTPAARVRLTGYDLGESGGGGDRSKTRFFSQAGVG